MGAADLDDVPGRRERIVRRLSHVHVIVGVHRRLASQRRARELAAPVGDHLVHVHVELGATARHPHMQGEHVVVLAGEDFVAGLDDQLVLLIAEPLAGMVCRGSGLLQDGIGGDHLARNQVLADAEMLERPLGLSAPQLVRRHFDYTEAIRFFSHVGHVAIPRSYRPTNSSRALLNASGCDAFKPCGPPLTSTSWLPLIASCERFPLASNGTIASESPWKSVRLNAAMQSSVPFGEANAAMSRA